MHFFSLQLATVDARFGQMTFCLGLLLLSWRRLCFFLNPNYFLVTQFQVDFDSCEAVTDIASTLREQMAKEQPVKLLSLSFVFTWLRVRM